MPWEDAFDPPRSMEAVSSDILGDWYRDPWGWPELAWVIQHSPQYLISRLNDNGAKRTLPIDVPKENFVTRPATILDPLDRLAYQCLVDAISRGLIGSLRDWVFGWRLSPRDPQRGYYEPNSDEWSRFRARLRGLGEQHHLGLTTDVVSYFASIDIDLLNEEIAGIAGTGRVTRRLADLLTSLSRVRRRPGLPQRCLASSVLAHVFLRPIDDLIHSRSKTTVVDQVRVRNAARWMDDLWLFGRSRRALRSIQLELQERLRDLGLNLNAAKTHLLEGDELREAIEELEHSAAEGALHEEPPDTRPLGQLVERILSAPETTDRTKIRFATTRIRWHAVFDWNRGFLNAAESLPHAADHLARLFRDANMWRDLGDWYVDHANRQPEHLSWSVYQLGTMFPSDEQPSEVVVNYFAEGLASGRLAKISLPLAAQRLARWQPDRARTVIADALDRPEYDHPFARRALALAGAALRVTRNDLRQWLSQDAENEVTLSFLAAHEFRPPRVVPDFSGD